MQSRIWKTLPVLLLATSAFAGGGSSGGKGGGGQSCFVETIHHFVAQMKKESPEMTAETLPFSVIELAAQRCEMGTPVIDCLAHSIAQGNPISDDVISSCEAAAEEPAPGTEVSGTELRN